MRNLTKSAEEKRQETIAAYVDGVLNGRSRQQFEQAMAQDETLRQEVAQLLLIKQSLRQLPLREVPRNFILDPAEFSRPPARQPWVQAYPVLRTATALAAFFFIFAVAAGAFTGFGLQASPSMAPAADVAEVQATIEVPEAAESLAFEAETAVEEEMAEEESVADTAVDAFAEVTTEEAEVAVETADEAEIAAEEVAPAEQAAPAEEPAAAPQNDAAEAGEGALATAVPAATILPEATPTASSSPRVTPPTPLPDRDLEQAELAQETANDAEADAPAPAVEDETANIEVTAVPTEEAGPELMVDQPASPLLWLQLGLGLLLLLLVSLTFYARRQR
ncbi:MAG: hypothetical protein WAS33_18715 [Candidatus Promineifilaceae bacterium]